MKVEVAAGPGLPVPKKPYGFCGRKAPWKNWKKTVKHQSPREMKRREVELNSHSRMDCLAAELFLNSYFSDTVFVTDSVPHSCWDSSLRSKQVASRWRSAHLLSIVRAVADVLFGLYGLERADSLSVICTWSLPAPHSPSLTIIIMYIYHALVNALSAHMIRINLNMIFYTHVEHSPTKRFT